MFRRLQKTESQNGCAVDDSVSPTSNSIECYACTQPGVPAFHSTSCDRAHQPQWEASAGSSLVPIGSRSNLKSDNSGGTGNRQSPGPFGRVLDPRSKRVQNWNRTLLLARGLAIFIDPLFFYALCIGQGKKPCLYMDGVLAASVIILRTCVDAVHLFHLWLQLRLAYVSRESLVVGCGKLVWDARAVATHYLRSLKGFWLDVFVILPIPQVVFLLVIPRLIRKDMIEQTITLLLLILLFQFIPRIYHIFCLMRRTQKVTGYLFGTIWWGFGLNLILYLVASHVCGGCWYLLSIQRVTACLRQHCEGTPRCNLPIACANEICYTFVSSKETLGNPCAATTVMVEKPLCLDADGPFRHGIYEWALPVITSKSIVIKIIYPIFWGLLTLSTFSNILEPTSQWLESLFSSITVLAGLVLFTALVGNIQVFSFAVLAKKRKMQLRCRDLEWWMKRRQLPSRLRRRVRHFERQKWAIMGGEDEMELIQDLPEGLKRDIKRHLCLDLIKMVPLFQNLDDIILDNICDRVKPLYFSKDEKIIREGDPVQRMVFIVRGRVKSSQNLSKGTVGTTVLEPGGFFGDELLSWCLRRPFISRLPASSATFVSVESSEAFGLDAHHLRFITEHFRYKFAKESLKRTARYYSSTWRTWAAVKIQFAWRRYVMRTRGKMVTVTEIAEGSEGRLRQYAVMFMSLRPHDHLE